MTGLLGIRPRAMPLRAAPGEKLGAAACAAGTKPKAQPVLPTPNCAPYGAPAISANAQPGMTPCSREDWHHREALGPSLRLIPPLLRGHTGWDDGGRG